MKIEKENKSMKKAYRLFVNNRQEVANLTEKEVDDICNEIDGTVIINRQYDIKLRNGDIVDLGIIDDILTDDFMKVERTNAVVFDHPQGKAINLKENN